MPDSQLSAPRAIVLTGLHNGTVGFDEYLLQVWPAEPAGERTLKLTSARARYWQSDKRNR